MKKILNIQTLMLMIVLLLPVLVHAGGGVSDPGSDPDSAPIDGGLSLLIAGGVGYGVKKMREKKNNTNE